MNDNMIRLSLSVPETELLDDILEVAYGEIYKIEIAKVKPNRVVPLSQHTFNFVKELRRHGKFDKLIIHDSEPVSAEYPDTTGNGRRCLKKIRF